MTELIKVDLLFVTKANVEHLSHFFECVDSLLESRCSSALLSEFTFAIETLVGSYDWHASDDCRDVRLRDIVVVIEVIYVEHKLHFLVELGTVNSEQA